jgi:hypothetical protein
VCAGRPAHTVYFPRAAAATPSWVLSSAACEACKAKWWPYYAPKLKQRTALLRKLKDIFQRFVSQPVNRVVELINPIVRGWVNYFR